MGDKFKYDDLKEEIKDSLSYSDRLNFSRTKYGVDQYNCPKRFFDDKNFYDIQKSYRVENLRNPFLEYIDPSMTNSLNLIKSSFLEAKAAINSEMNTISIKKTDIPNKFEYSVFVDGMIYSATMNSDSLDDRLLKIYNSIQCGYSESNLLKEYTEIICCKKRQPKNNKYTADIHINFVALLIFSVWLKAMYVKNYTNISEFQIIENIFSNRPLACFPQHASIQDIKDVLSQVKSDINGFNGISEKIKVSRSGEKKYTVCIDGKKNYILSMSENIGKRLSTIYNHIKRNGDEIKSLRNYIVSPIIEINTSKPKTSSSGKNSYHDDFVCLLILSVWIKCNFKEKTLNETEIEIVKKICSDNYLDSLFDNPRDFLLDFDTTLNSDKEISKNLKVSYSRAVTYSVTINGKKYIASMTGDNFSEKLKDIFVAIQFNSSTISTLAQYIESPIHEKEPTEDDGFIPREITLHNYFVCLAMYAIWLKEKKYKDILADKNEMDIIKGLINIIPLNSFSCTLNEAEGEAKGSIFGNLSDEEICDVLRKHKISITDNKEEVRIEKAFKYACALIAREAAKIPLFKYLREKDELMYRDIALNIVKSVDIHTETVNTKPLIKSLIQATEDKLEEYIRLKNTETDENGNHIGKYFTRADILEDLKKYAVEASCSDDYTFELKNKQLKDFFDKAGDRYKFKTKIHRLYWLALYYSSDYISDLEYFGDGQSEDISDIQTNFLIKSAGINLSGESPNTRFETLKILAGMYFYLKPDGISKYISYVERDLLTFKTSNRNKQKSLLMICSTLLCDIDLKIDDKKRLFRDVFLNFGYQFETREIVFLLHKSHIYQEILDDSYQKSMLEESNPAYFYWYDLVKRNVSDISHKVYEYRQYTWNNTQDFQSASKKEITDTWVEFLHDIQLIENKIEKAVTYQSFFYAIFNIVSSHNNGQEFLDSFLNSNSYVKNLIAEIIFDSEMIIRSENKLYKKALEKDYSYVKDYTDITDKNGNFLFLPGGGARITSAMFNSKITKLKKDSKKVTDWKPFIEKILKGEKDPRYLFLFSRIIYLTTEIDPLQEYKGFKERLSGVTFLDYDNVTAEDVAGGFYFKQK